jgi:hypothetical protein
MDVAEFISHISRFRVMASDLADSLKDFYGVRPSGRIDVDLMKIPNKDLKDTVDHLYLYVFSRIIWPIIKDAKINHCGHDFGNAATPADTAFVYGLLSEVDIQVTLKSRLLHVLLNDLVIAPGETPQVALKYAVEEYLFTSVPEPRNWLRVMGAHRCLKCSEVFSAAYDFESKEIRFYADGPQAMSIEMSDCSQVLVGGAK